MLIKDLYHIEPISYPGALISEQEFWNICNDLIPGDRCPWCQGGILEYSLEDLYHSEELICPKCYSDYAYYSE